MYLYLTVCQSVHLAVCAAYVCLFGIAMQPAVANRADSVPHELESVIAGFDQVICLARSLFMTTAT